MEKEQQARKYSPAMHGVQIMGKRGRLFSVIYTAGGEKPRPTVLLLHGIPGNEQNMDLAQELRRNGFHVITFHYSGCFGSDGNYALSHNIEDANTVLDYICSDIQYGFDKERIFVVGHSIGGFVASHLSALRQEIKGAAVLMPCNIGRIFKIQEESPRAAEKLLDILEESAKWLQGASIEKFLDELKSNSERFRLENLAQSLAQKPFLCIEAEFDEHTPPQYHCRPLEEAIYAIPGNRLRVVRLATDHLASDCRLELCDNVVSYINDLNKECF